MQCLFLVQPLVLSSGGLEGFLPSRWLCRFPSVLCPVSLPSRGVAHPLWIYHFLVHLSLSGLGIVREVISEKEHAEQAEFSDYYGATQELVLLCSASKSFASLYISFLHGSFGRSYLFHHCQRSVVGFLGISRCPGHVWDDSWASYPVLQPHVSSQM